MQTRESIGIWRKPVGAGLWLAALLVCGGIFARSVQGAATPNSPEERAFRSAFKLFQDGHFPLAENNFGDFLAKYTNSPHRADAVLYQARARLGQSNFEGAIDLLQKSSAEAGGLLSEYIFWTAKARLAAGDLQRAADGFAQVARDFPSSRVRLEAAFDEAEVHSRTGDWGGVIGLLQKSDGPFQLASGQDTRVAAEGWLLLGEALLREHRPDEGEKVVLGLDPGVLTQGDLRWRRQYLLCRLRLAGGRAEAALAASTNLLAMGQDPPHQASSVFLQGQILETLGRGADALRVYATNLTEAQPPDAQEQALARTLHLTVALNPLPEAMQAVNALITNRPTQAPGQDLAHLSLGELSLRGFADPREMVASSNAPAAPDTNLLASALINLSVVISNFTNSPLLAKAHLDRGWCEWLSTNMAAAQTDFAEAAARLTFPPDQAVARFKLADAQFALKDYTNAAVNYSLVLTNTAPEVTNALFDLALYQLAQSDILRGDDEGARAAVDKILRWYRESYFGDRGSLLMGEDLSRKYDYAGARKVFTALRERSPHSPLLAEVEFAIARTLDYEGQWNQAIAHYKEWENQHAGETLLPDVQFHLALAEGKAGLTNEALAGFTNFVVRFPTNALAPWALNCVADYYYNQPDYHLAETYYQELFQKYPGAGELAYQARFWAGKSALASQETKDAHDYFVDLVNPTNSPPELVARGYFALGEIFFQQFQAGQTVTNLDQAIAAISKLTNGAPTNEIAVEALGRLGDYYMAWADKNPSANNYAIARQMYEAVVAFPADGVNVSARSQAETGLGVVAEKEHNESLALEHYCNVVYKYNPAHFDPYWVGQAGESAARIYENQQHWNEAIALYQRVLEAVPALRPVLEKRIAAAQTAQARLEADRK